MFLWLPQYLLSSSAEVGFKCSPPCSPFESVCSGVWSQVLMLTWHGLPPWAIAQICLWLSKRIKRIMCLCGCLCVGRCRYPWGPEEGIRPPEARGCLTTELCIYLVPVVKKKINEIGSPERARPPITASICTSWSAVVWRPLPHTPTAMNEAVYTATLWFSETMS